MIETGTVIVIAFAMYALGMLSHWYFTDYEAEDFVREFSTWDEAVYLIGHLGISAADLIRDILDDAISIWYDDHVGSDEGCDVGMIKDHKPLTG